MKINSLLIRLVKYSLIGIFLQCLFVTLILAEKSVAQRYQSVKEISISVDLENASLKEAFNYIELKTGLTFNFDDNQLYSNKATISFNDRNSTVEELLLHISKQANLRFRQVNDNINVLKSKKKVKNNETKIEIILQGVNVTGKVISSDDESGLPGVNIVVKGTSIGTVTDINGNYNLEAPSAESILVFSSVGYSTEEIKVGTKTIINVNMVPDITALSEIVVIGYGSVKKSDLTGAVVSLDEKDMTLGGAINSVSGMLQGRAAGVEVSSNDGLPGQQLNIVIRGTTSISNSNEPLYVVDGFPIAAGVSISPEDIESIDILKDAASAAIYGSRASAGVVIITTKRGKSGKTDIELNGYYGIQEMNGNVERLDWAEHARIVNEQYAMGPNDGNPWYDAADLALPNNTDWLEEVTRQAPIQNYTLRASGGDDKSHFSLTGNYFAQDGIFLNSAFERLSFRLNADRKFGAKTKVGMNIYSSRVSSDAMDRRPGSRTLSPLYATLRTPPGRAAYNEDGTLAQTVFSRDQRPFRNPIGFFTERDNDYREWRTYANMFIDYNILDNFVARVNLGVDHTSGTHAQYQPLEVSTLGNLPYGSIDETKSSTYLIEGTLDYKFDFSNEAHNLNILAGASTQYDDYFSFGLSGSGFPTDKTGYYNLGSAENQFINSYREDKTLISFFGRANYGFKNKLLLTATLRADGASQFGDNKKWGTFPSASAAWRIVEEDFMSGLPIFSDLKFRASYGITGNNGFSPYTSLARVGATNKVYTYDGVASVSGLGSDGVFAPNPDLQWETTRMTNFGLDFGMWDNRLYGSLEVYLSDTEDLIIDKPISAPSTGYTLIRANVGSIKNNGVELTLGGRILTGDSFTWTADVNFSQNNNEITQLDGDNPIILGIARQPYGEIGEHPYRQLITGGKMGDFFGYTYKGVLQPGEAYAPQPNTTQPGSALYEDINDDGIINSDDRSVIGNANPDYMWGFNNRFQWKGVYLDMFWQGVVGNDIFNFKSIAHDQTLTTRALERWSPTNPNGTRPGIDWFANEYGSYVNSDFIEDGSYIRLKNIVLGYNFNMKNVAWIDNINLYLQGQNLVTITDYTGYDPEVSFNYSGSQNSVNRGVDDFGFPMYKTYTLGLKVIF